MNHELKYFLYRTIHLFYRIMKQQQLKKKYWFDVNNNNYNIPHFCYFTLLSVISTFHIYKI